MQCKKEKVIYDKIGYILIYILGWIVMSVFYRKLRMEQLI